jgi:hypothetical protein
MSDRPDADSKPGDPPAQQIRKAWHTPQFVITGLIDTEVMGNGGSDAGPLNQPS